MKINKWFFCGLLVFSNLFVGLSIYLFRYHLSPPPSLPNLPQPAASLSQMQHPIPSPSPSPSQFSSSSFQSSSLSSTPPVTTTATNDTNVIPCWKRQLPVLLDLSVSQRQIIFLHVPKCGGTAVAQMLGRISPKRYGRRDGLPIYKTPSFIDQYDFFVGHIALSEHRPTRTCAVVVFLREPIKRGISLFSYVRTKLLKDSRNNTEIFRSTANAQVTFLSDRDHANLEVAKKNLDEHVAFFGLVEDMQVGLCTIGRLLDIPYPKGNTKINPSVHMKLPQDSFDALLQYNTLDIEFYKYAYARYFQQDVPFFQECREETPNRLLPEQNTGSLKIFP